MGRVGNGHGKLLGENKKSKAAGEEGNIRLLAKEGEDGGRKDVDR